MPRKDEEEMNEEMKRLWKNIKKLMDANVLEVNFEVFSDMYCETIADLNGLIEEEISYWPQDCEGAHE
jgi:hypothetical protein